jgi:hypothetical protein
MHGQPGGERPPAWAGIIARIVLALGILLALGTVVGGMSSESLGVNLAMATGGPLGFGIVATLLTRKHSTGGAGKPIGFGCLAGFLLSTLVTVFFVAIFPAL